MEVCISKEDAISYMAHVEWAEVTSWLKTEFSTNSSDEELLKPLVDLLFNIINRVQNNFLWYNCLEAQISDTLTVTLKTLRLFVTKANVGDYISKQPQFFDALNTLSVCLLTKKNGPEVFTKYLLQCLVNLVSAGSIQQKGQLRKIIRGHKLSHNIQNFFLTQWGWPIESSALIYNLYYDIEITDRTLVTEIIKFHTKATYLNEYSDFLIQKIVSENCVWEYFVNFTYQRLNLLRLLRYYIAEQVAESDPMSIQVEQLPESCLKCLTIMFNESAVVVFQVTNEDDLAAVEEVSCVLKLLACISSNEKSLAFLQNNKDLLINASVLLINLHRIGKASNNVFTPILKLAEINNPSEDITRNPAFGFKADLVRLIGNLCWKNQMMQNLAREGEIIPILLDSCNIDAKNPFIIQWVIYAIRNICENNLENQSVIAGLTQRGFIDSKVLQEFGLTLSSEEMLSIGIVGLDLNK
ncbi:unnamed protein product [Ceutorhynchus assimilis]|uniref:Ataxin-10 n=1 Tax=Ceutorhynchus assimilis TaxID=467358 RepID=A0A9N9MP13_9CUCU|nr:unnamed protein product [Ceutorhynchus assimilis]